MLRQASLSSSTGGLGLRPRFTHMKMPERAQKRNSYSCYSAAWEIPDGIGAPPVDSRYSHEPRAQAIPPYFFFPTERLPGKTNTRPQARHLSSLNPEP